MAKLVNRSSIKFKILSVVFASLLMLTLTLGFFSFRFNKNRIIVMLGDSIKGVSASIASFIPAKDVEFVLNNSENVSRTATSPDDIENLLNPSKSPKAVCEKYSTLLGRIKKMSEIDSSIYVYVASGNRLLAVLTSEPTYWVGSVYLMRPEAREAVSSGIAQTTGIYKDKDGLWISAYVPGERLSSGNRQVVVEVNCKIDSYVRMLFQELGIIIIISVMGFLMAALISYYLITALVSTIKKLDEAIDELEKEHYDKPIDIKTDDEVGHLATTFEMLRVSIKRKIDDMRLSLKREKRAHLESVIALTNAIEERDPYTKKHVSRVQEYALLIAKVMHLSHEDMVQLRYSCYLHDIGKIYIENALLKRIDLSHDDFEEIKKHSGRGANIIEGIEFLTDVKKAVLHHHEWYNGKGYPSGLKGNEIPVMARIVAVADAFDAMTTDRPYRSKISFANAMEEIERKSGIQFDPDVCAALLTYRNTLENMMQKHFADDA